MRLAYITVNFPSMTETFVLREVFALKKTDKLDFVDVYSYKRPDRGWENKDHIDLMKKTIYLRSRFLYNLFSLFYFLFFNFIGFCRVFKLWFKESSRLSLKDVYRSFVHIFAGFGLARTAKEHKIEFFHSHFSTASTVALTANLLTDIPFSFTAHASGDIYIYSPFLNEKLKRAKKIIAVSEYNKKYLEAISHYSIDTDKIKVIYNGVTIPEKKISDTSNDIPVLFISAAFTGFKGYGTLVKALEIVKNKKIPFKCFAVGSGPLFEMIKKEIHSHSLDYDFIQLGAQPYSEVEKFLKMADIFVFPSEIYMNGARDGMPTAITEAMSYSLPVVATYITGIPEQVIDGQNGFLVPERNEYLLAEKIEALLIDQNLRKRMGAESYQIACSKFDIEKNTSKLIDTFIN